MRLTTATALLLAVVPVAFLGVFLAAPPSAFRSAPAFALAVLLAMVLQAVLVTRDYRSAPFDLLVVGVVTVFFLVRVPVLWLAPAQFIYPGHEFEPDDFTWTLAFLVAGTAAAVMGFRLGVGWRPWLRTPRREAAPLLRVSLTRLLSIGILYFGIETLLWIYLGTASSALAADAPVSGGLLFLRHFISLYAATGIGLVAGLDRWPHLNRIRRAQFIAFLGLFIFYTIAGGSRSGLITLLTMATIYLLIRKGNFTFGTRALSMTLGALALAIVVFPAATIIRYGWLSASELQQGQFTLDVSRGNEGGGWLAAGLTSGFNRLNGLDPLLMIVARKEARPVADYVTPAQVAKSAVNLLVPSALLGGEPFPGVLSTSRLFSAVYRGRSDEFIATWYQTDMWTFWGCAFALGGWTRGPVLMLAIAAFLGAGYRRIIKRGGQLGLIWRLWWIYSSYLVLISYGFDVDFAASASLLVGGTVVVILLRPRAWPARVTLSAARA